MDGPLVGGSHENIACFLCFERRKVGLVQWMDDSIDAVGQYITAISKHYLPARALTHGRSACKIPICVVEKFSVPRQYIPRNGRKKTAPAFTIKYQILGTVLRLNLEGRPFASSVTRWRAL
jgi:hypothetical protein